MTKRALFALTVVTSLGCGAAGGVAACSSADGGGATDGGPSSDVAASDAPPPASFRPEIPCTDSIASVYADPGNVSAKPKGAILRCAHDQDLTAAQLMAAAQAGQDAGNLPYSGKAFTSGAHVYRVLYRTERGDPANTPGYSSALLLLPETPRNGTGHPLPPIVAAHGSRGQAGKCAPSLADPAASDVEEDFIHLVYPLVGLGFPVIAPDLAGYANIGAPGNPPPTYDALADVGKSMLDGARAIRNVVPRSLTQQIAIVGHSQGGYTALAALALADSYGADGVLSAVAVYSPLWLSQRTAAAIFLEPSNYGFQQSAAGVVSLWYHYTHSALLDGQDAALELFDPAKAGVVQSFVNDDCWQESYPDLLDAGASANDFFSQAYLMAMQNGGSAEFGSCNGNSLCQTWLDRMTADYPHLDGGPSKVPLLVWYANADDTITPDLMQCVFNRLSGDGTNLQVCYDTNPVGHGGVVAENADYVAEWIAHQTLPEAGAPPAGNCHSIVASEGGVPQIADDAGMPVSCNSLVPTQ